MVVGNVITIFVRRDLTWSQRKGLASFRQNRLGGQDPEHAHTGVLRQLRQVGRTSRQAGCAQQEQGTITQVSCGTCVRQALIVPIECMQQIRNPKQISGGTLIR